MLYSEQFKFNAVIRYLSGPHRSYTSVARDIELISPSFG